MTDAAAVVVGAIARSNEVAPPLSRVVARFAPEAREELVNTLNQLQGEVLVIWWKRDDDDLTGPRITLTPAGAKRFGWRLDDDSRFWVPAHQARKQIKILPRKRMISLTDFARGRGARSGAVEGALGYLSRIVDPSAVDPAKFVEIDDDDVVSGRRRRAGRPRRDVEPRPPAIIMTGCRPWPPQVFADAAWKCQVCRDRPLAASMECAWCDRGGQDALIPPAIRAQIRQARNPKPVRRSTRLKGGRDG